MTAGLSVRIWLARPNGETECVELRLAPPRTPSSRSDEPDVRKILAIAGGVPVTSVRCSISACAPMQKSGSSEVFAPPLRRYFTKAWPVRRR